MTMKQMVPALFGVAVAQLSILINTNIASHLERGAVTWLNYADRLMEFPTALLGVAVRHGASPITLSRPRCRK